MKIRISAADLHDPTERLLSADRFEGAARALESGAKPDKLGIPRLGVNPPWPRIAYVAEGRRGESVTGVISARGAND
jgi:hypothetical protein